MLFSIGDLFFKKYNKNIGILINCHYSVYYPYLIKWIARNEPISYQESTLKSVIHSKEWKHYPVKKYDCF